MFYILKYQSPIGLLYLVANDKHLCGVIFAVLWHKFSGQLAKVEEKETPLLIKAKQQLTEYFAGKRLEFDLPLQPAGTAFQKKVWQSLETIPFGTTQTYKEQARAIAAPTAMRAVGRADGLNPLCIILPCHRVIGSRGALTGYAGGLEAKKFLLDLEATALISR